MYHLFQEKLTPRQLGQLYRSVQLDYLLSSMPTEDVFDSTDLRTYQNFTIMGQLQAIKLQTHDQTQYFTLFLKSLYSSYERLYRIYIPIATYKEYFIRFMNQGIKKKGQFHMLVTELEPFLIQNQIVFGVTKRSATIILPLEYKEKEFSQILKAFDSRYSYIKFEQVFNACEVDFYKDNGIPFQDLKTKFTTSPNPQSSLLTILGAVQIKSIDRQKLGRKLCKVISFNLYQTEIKYDARELGVYNVKGYFYFESEEDFKTKLIDWTTVMIKNVQRVVSNSGKLEYMFHADEDITVVDPVQWRYAPNLMDIWSNLRPIQLKDIKSSAMMRNYVKLRVELIKMPFIKLSFECKQCKTPLKFDRCQDCDSKAEFLIWAQCQVQDASDFGQISLQGSNLQKYLDLSASQMHQLQQLCIKYSRNLLINKNFESTDAIVRKLFYLMNVKKIEKDVIGIPTMDLRRRVGDGDAKQDVGCDMKGYKSLNVNGVIDRREGSNKWLAKIKVYQVIEPND